MAVASLFYTKCGPSWSHLSTLQAARPPARLRACCASLPSQTQPTTLVDSPWLAGEGHLAVHASLLQLDRPLSFQAEHEPADPPAALNSVQQCLPQQVILQDVPADDCEHLGEIAMHHTPLLQPAQASGLQPLPQASAQLQRSHRRVHQHADGTFQRAVPPQRPAAPHEPSGDWAQGTGPQQLPVHTTPPPGCSASAHLLRQADQSDPDVQIAKQLTCKIAACTTSRQLHHVLHTHCSSLNAIHVSAALRHLVRLHPGMHSQSCSEARSVRPPRRSPPPKSGSSNSLQQQFSSQSANQAAHAAPHVPYVPHPAAAPQNAAAAQQRHHTPLSTEPSILPAEGQQGPILPMHPVAPAMAHSTASAPVWPRPPGPPTPPARVQAHGTAQEAAASQAALEAQGASAATAAALAADLQATLVLLAGLGMHHLSAMSLWELTSVMSSFIKLRAPLKKSYYVSLMVQARRDFSSPATTAQGLAELIWGVASSGMHKLQDNWGWNYCAAVAARWDQFEPRGLVRVLHGLAWLKYTPNPAWSTELLDRMAVSDRTSPQDAAITLWAVVKLRLVAPPELLRALCERLLATAPSRSAGGSCGAADASSGAPTGPTSGAPSRAPSRSFSGAPSKPTIRAPSQARKGAPSGVGPLATPVSSSMGGVGASPVRHESVSSSFGSRAGVARDALIAGGDGPLATAYSSVTGGAWDAPVDPRSSSRSSTGRSGDASPAAVAEGGPIPSTITAVPKQDVRMPKKSQLRKGRHRVGSDHTAPGSQPASEGHSSSASSQLGADRRAAPGDTQTHPGPQRTTPGVQQPRTASPVHSASHAPGNQGAHVPGSPLPRDLSVALWSLAHMDWTPPAVLQEGLLHQVTAAVPFMSGHSLALTVYALGQLSWTGHLQPVHALLMQAASTRWVGLGPQGMGLLIQGAAASGAAPGEPWLSGFNTRLEALGYPKLEGKGGTWHPAGVELVRSGLEVLGYTPPRIRAPPHAFGLLPQQGMQAQRPGFTQAPQQHSAARETGYMQQQGLQAQPHTLGIASQQGAVHRDGTQPHPEGQGDRAQQQGRAGRAQAHGHAQAAPCEYFPSESATSVSPLPVNSSQAEAEDLAQLLMEPDPLAHWDGHHWAMKPLHVAEPPPQDQHQADGTHSAGWPQPQAQQTQQQGVDAQVARMAQQAQQKSNLPDPSLDSDLGRWQVAQLEHRPSRSSR